MADKTKIEWTDASWNPVTGCSKVSAGCKNCYAEVVADKFWATQYPPIPLAPVGTWRDGEPASRTRRFTDVQCHADRLSKPLQWQRPRMIFVNSMSDLFHELVPTSFIDQIMGVMIAAERHTFQVLTKRPQRMREYLTDWVRRSQSMPPSNIWFGVSVENQEQANIRIPLLLETPAAVRWISAEPLLDAIDLNQIAARHAHGVSYWNALTGFRGNMGGGYTDERRLDWVVVGGESGPNHRPIQKDWVWSLREQCAAANVAFFFKQWGGKTPKSGGRTLNGKLYSEYPQQAQNSNLHIKTKMIYSV